MSRGEVRWIKMNTEYGMVGFQRAGHERDAQDRKHLRVLGPRVNGNRNVLTKNSSSRQEVFVCPAPAFYTNVSIKLFFAPNSPGRIEWSGSLWRNQCPLCLWIFPGATVRVGLRSIP